MARRIPSLRATAEVDTISLPSTTATGTCGAVPVAAQAAMTGQSGHQTASRRVSFMPAGPSAPA
jgi:hypothetical protein